MYYRRHIKNFVATDKPFHRLTEKGHEFCWTGECVDVQKDLRPQLVYINLILAFPDYSLPFILTQVLAGQGLEAFFLRCKEEKEPVIAYMLIVAILTK